MATDIEIARAAKLEPILKIAEKIGIPAEAVEPYGTKIGKVDLGFLAEAQERAKSRPKSKLILVTAINPTAAGEGKTTTSVGLADALRHVGKKSVVALREPSLGPCFGMKGGAAGGGYAQVVPMEAINLHFTGDFHAISAAHNLLAAMIDNHIYWGNEPAINSRRVALRRVVDMNDRALRQIVVSLGGVANGYPRENGFDITVASEVMAIFCLARNLEDLQERLGKIVVAYGPDKKPITAEDLKAAGAMTVLLKDALMPNLVQTLEGTPAFIHGGPFANIAHGCNSVIATTAGLALADYTVTEAGFGADLGAEKFLDIKCRKAGLAPSAAVIVATLRALKAQGGVAKADLGKENHAAVKAGLANLGRHVANVRKFGVPVVVAINHFGGDHEDELEIIAKTSRDEFGAEAIALQALGGGRQGRGQARRESRRARRVRQSQFPRALSRRPVAHREDAQDRARDLWREGHFGRARRRRNRSPISRRLASVICPSAWRRRNIPSRPIRRSSAHRAATSSACAKCGSRPAPVSS